MDSTQIFWIQLLTSVVVFGIVAVWYVWPSLTKLSRNSALIPLLFVHVPRYVGMTLLVGDDNQPPALPMHSPAPSPPESQKLPQPLSAKILVDSWLTTRFSSAEI